MSLITTERSLFLNVLNCLKVVADNQKAIEKAGRKCFPDEFDRAFRLTGGPYKPVAPPSAPNSDDESGDSDDDAATATTTTNASAVAKKSAYWSLLMLLRNILEEQMELAARLRPLVKLPAVMQTALQACEVQLGVMGEAVDFVDSAVKATLDEAADGILHTCVRDANEVGRRTRGLLAWAKLKRIGDVAAAAAATAVPGPVPVPAASSEPPTAPVATPAARTPSPQSVSQPNTIHSDGGADGDGGVVDNLASESEQPPTEIKSFRQSLASVVADAGQPFAKPAADASLVPQRNSISSRGYNNNDDDDDRSDHPMDAAGVLDDVANQLVFDTSAIEVVHAEPATPADDPLFSRDTEQGRRNIRAKKLLSFDLEQTDELLTPERVKLVGQFATVRDFLSVLGKVDYNILSFLVRTIPQQIGETGPVLWCAAVDLCVLKRYEDIDNNRKRWAEERVGDKPPVSTEPDNYEWVELVRSETCVRNGQAKLKVVTAAAELLFPREFKLYCSLGRDDVYTGDSMVKGRDSKAPATGNAAAFGRVIRFSADRTTSFVKQAFEIMEAHEPHMGRMTLQIRENRRAEQQTNVPVPLEDYLVRIVRGDSTVVAEQCSTAYTNQFSENKNAEVTPLVYKSLHVISQTTLTSPPLLATVFDALHNAAEKIGVLPKYQQLKESFDNLRLPVANEPREYVLNFVSLVFGTFLLNGTLKDMVQMHDQPFGAGWGTTIRIGFPSTPTDPAGEVKYVQLEQRVASTKKAARNEALLYAGKTNFTPELLYMMEYGTVPQKGHAESILVVDTTPAVCFHHPFLEKIAQRRSVQKRAEAQVSGAYSSPGQVMSPFPAIEKEDHDPFRFFISDAIVRNLPYAVSEMKTWLTQNHSDFKYTLSIDKKIVDSFLLSLPQKELQFGRFTYPTQNMPNGMELEGSTASISGRSPIFALYLATRALREIVENYSTNSRASKNANAARTAAQQEAVQTEGAGDSAAAR